MNGNVHVVENKAFRRFKVLSYDPKTNFCRVVSFTDDLPREIIGSENSNFNEDLTNSFKDELNEDERDALMIQTKQVEDLMVSELNDLKNQWFVFNKKM